jgi:hypothetical protein
MQYDSLQMAILTSLHGCAISENHFPVALSTLAISVTSTGPAKCTKKLPSQIRVLFLADSLLVLAGLCIANVTIVTWS